MPFRVTHEMSCLAAADCRGRLCAGQCRSAPNLTEVSGGIWLVE